jgi:hypothetical protein
MSQQAAERSSGLLVTTLYNGTDCWEANGSATATMFNGMRTLTAAGHLVTGVDGIVGRLLAARFEWYEANSPLFVPVQLPPAYWWWEEGDVAIFAFPKPPLGWNDAYDERFVDVNGGRPKLTFQKIYSVTHPARWDCETSMVTYENWDRRVIYTSGPGGGGSSGGGAFWNGTLIAVELGATWLKGEAEESMNEWTAGMEDEVWGLDTVADGMHRQHHTTEYWNKVLSDKVVNAVRYMRSRWRLIGGLTFSDFEFVNLSAAAEEHYRKQREAGL